MTVRVLEIPALNELRKACTELLRAGQAAGTVRADIDAASVGNGIIALMLAVLMSVTQLGSQTAIAYSHDVAAVFEAALTPPATARLDRPPPAEPRPRSGRMGQDRFMTLTLTLNFCAMRTATLLTNTNGAAPRRNGRPDPDQSSYRWIALVTVTIGTLMVFINQSIVLISLPDIFRGIQLNPLTPGNTGYLLWMLMGFTVVLAVLVVTLGRVGRHLRPGQDLQPRLHRLHRLLDPAGRDLAHRHAGRHLAHRHAHRAGRRRRHALRQLVGHHHRRLPRR